MISFNPFFYQAIAEKFPEMPLLTVLVAEKKFIEADTDKSGVSYFPRMLTYPRICLFNTSMLFNVVVSDKTSVLVFVQAYLRHFCFASRVLNELIIISCLF